MASPTAVDEFANHGPIGGLDSPAYRMRGITPSNSEELPYVTRAVYCGSGGTLIVVDTHDVETVFTNTQAGQIVPIRVKQIKESTTSSPTVTNTCTGIVALS